MSRKLGVQLIAFLSILLLIMPSLSFTTQSAPQIDQKTIIVDINGNGDYTSISDAVANAQITDIIKIRQGVYEEHDISIDKKIEIIGEDPENTIMNCSGIVAFNILSTYVDISNLQIRNTGEFGILVRSGSTGCTISNCIIDTNRKGTAIELVSSYSRVSNCSLFGLDTSKHGVKIQGSNNVVENCDIQDFANGVLVLIGSNNNQILNCNIINNENAIDFRLDSNNNLATGCNIYSNLQSVKVWQNSNYNKIYLNNFWKNDISAIDEGNNSWDNGAQGNYWDKYLGVDSDNDGIGDTPYEISSISQDRYPQMSLILPDIVTPPSNLEIVSSKSDNTPTFTWTASIYSREIQGYYVKVDSGSEEFIGDTTTWTSQQSLSDGVHTLYVRAESLDGKSSASTSLPFTIDVTYTDADEDGWSDEDEILYGTDPNDPNNYPIDSDGDYISDSVDTDDDNDGYSDVMEQSYGTQTTNPNSRPTDTDADGTPNEDSLDGKYIGDQDDDNDGLPDIDENTIGSNPLDKSDVKRIYASGKVYYLVDISQTGYYDLLYDSESETTNGIENRGEDYLLDTNNDGTWDHIYSGSTGLVSRYEEPLVVPIFVWIILIIAMIISAIILVPYYLKRRPPKPIGHKLSMKPKKTIEKPLLRKPVKMTFDTKKDTVHMVSQTKALLQHIQQDVEVYMDQLQQIEEQFSEIPEEDKEERPPPIVPITSHYEKIQDIEIDGETPEVEDIDAKVDKFLSMHDKKKRNN